MTSTARPGLSTMDFDDLASYWNVGGAKKSLFCRDCKQNVLVPRVTGKCPDCQKQLAEPEPEHKASAMDPIMQALMGQFGQAGPVDLSVLGGFGGAGGAGGRQTSMAELISAQQGVDIEALMQQMLTEGGGRVQSTSKQFLKDLKPFRLALKDCFQIAVATEGMGRPMFATQAAFGPSLLAAHQAAGAAAASSAAATSSSSTGAVDAGASATAAATADPFAAATAAVSAPTPPPIQEQLSLPLVASSVPEGDATPSNAKDFAGAMVYMRRGKVSFVAKCRLAQQLGARAVLVAQTEDVWPYVMGDDAKAGGDIAVPCLMISRADAAALDALLKDPSKAVRHEVKDDASAAASSLALATTQVVSTAGAGAGSSSASPAHPRTCVFTQGRAFVVPFFLVLQHLASLQIDKCRAPVCRDGLDAGVEVVKLPCSHYYHEDCIKKWLLKTHTCPLCRYDLPTESTKAGESEERKHNHQLLHNAMFT